MRTHLSQSAELLSDLVVQADAALSAVPTSENVVLQSRHLRTSLKGAVVRRHCAMLSHQLQQPCSNLHNCMPLSQSVLF